MSPYTLSESFEVVIALFWRQHGPAIAVFYYDRLVCRVPVADTTAGKIPAFDSGDLAVKYLVHIPRKVLRANPANVVGSISRLRPLGSVVCNVIGNNPLRLDLLDLHRTAEPVGADRRSRGRRVSRLL
jgi:hypothetical protein